MSTDTTPRRPREILWDANAGDFGMYLDGELMGYARSYGDGDRALDELEAAIVAHAAALLPLLTQAEALAPAGSAAQDAYRDAQAAVEEVAAMAAVPAAAPRPPCRMLWRWAGTAAALGAYLAAQWPAAAFWAQGLTVDEYDSPRANLRARRVLHPDRASYEAHVRRLLAAGARRIGGRRIKGEERAA